LARSDILDPGEVAMRWNVLLVAATLLVAASLPSAAQISVDMNEITCGDWLGYNSENRDFVRFWMSGYYNSAANSTILNYDRFQRSSAKVANYCRSHKSQTLPTAIKNLGLWK
jgi:HdeA/HdeB family